MAKMEINGVEVNIIATGIKKYGYDNLIEIDEYPYVQHYKKMGSYISDETEDWPVIETEKMKLYMNNCDGYIVIIEYEQTHYEENKGMVLDEEGHIYYTIF